MRYQALILDMDGTLLNSKQMVRDSLRQLAVDYHLAPLTEEHFVMAYGCETGVLMEHLGLPLSAADRWREIMSEMLQQVPLYSGVSQVLDAPIRRGLVTSQTRQELIANMRIHHMQDVFEHTVSVNDTPHAKPHPLPLQSCIEAMQLQADEALFVGDSVYDYECALAAGVDFGLACWGAEDDTLFEHSSYFFRQPEEMLIPIRSIA